MGIHTKTIGILEDQKRCEAILAALLLNYNKEFIKRRFGITRHQLDHIIDVYETSLTNENEGLRTCEPDAEQG